METRDLYSVFNWQTGIYHIFAGPGRSLGLRPKPRAIFDEPNGRGRQLETVLPLVPQGSKEIGTSSTPKGRIAVIGVESQSMAGIIDGTMKPESAFNGFGADSEATQTSPWVVLGLWITAVYTGLKLAKKAGEWAGSKVR
jgi:hypothetical protein